jgi:hypothetical protein
MQRAKDDEFFHTPPNVRHLALWNLRKAQA